MTGFGDASSTTDGVHWFVEVRSVNNKYFKSTIRLPEEMQPIEPEVESALRRRLTRGSIICTARCSDTSEAAALTVNGQALNRYVQQIRAAQQLAGDGAFHLDLGALLALPGVLQPPMDDEARLERARRAIMPLVDEACDHLVSMRRREGAMLVDDLMQHHGFIDERLATIRDLAPTVVDDYQQRLRARIDKLLADLGQTIEPGDLIKEVAIFAERTDIAEELARLSAHLDQFKDILTKGDTSRPIGRTLDFLSQEMLREANTIASKSPNAEISRSIVEVKGAIDRIKEQVQNVE
jgi:uncharacterized protein (TIGR00255 family)